MQLASYLAGSDLRLAIYFLLGGSVTVLTAYFAGQGRGMLSAFITTLPLQTAFSFLLIYAEGGSKTVEEYARSLLIVLLFVILSVLMQRMLPGTKL